MVNSTQLSNIFSALADPVRRDIIERIQRTELTVNQIAIDYDMSLAAVSKHLKILYNADLIHKRKSGRYVFVTANRNGLQEAIEYLADARPGEF